MTNRSSTFLLAFLFAIALIALVSVMGLCQAQVADTIHTPSAPSSENGSTTETKETADGIADQTNTIPQAGGSHPGIAALASRARVFTRNGPTRESWTAINLGTKYANAILGGFEQGAVLGLGVQFTTSDRFRFVEFRATALTSLNLYRRFEGEAYFPRVFDKKTHADVWFDYVRRTKDTFFGIGPRIPNTSQTNFGLEQRSYNASLYHDFSVRLQVGGYFSESNSSTYRGDKKRDIPIDRLFSGDLGTVPAEQWAPIVAKNDLYADFLEFKNDSGEHN